MIELIVFLVILIIYYVRVSAESYCHEGDKDCDCPYCISGIATAAVYANPNYTAGLSWIT